MVLSASLFNNIFETLLLALLDMQTCVVVVRKRFS